MNESAFEHWIGIGFCIAIIIGAFMFFSSCTKGISRTEQANCWEKTKREECWK